MSTYLQPTRYLLALTILLASLLSALPLTAVAAAEPDFTGKRIVPLLQEPRHRTVHRDGDLYLLDVQLNPGDTSFPHVHESAILVTSISNGAGPTNGRVSANTDYATEPFTHEISNDGPGLLRIIALTNFGPGQQNVSGGRPSGLAGEPTVENPWFRSYRVVLEPGAETAEIRLQNPGVVVQVTEGKLHVSRPDGITAELDAMAKWAWRDAGTPFRVRNVGTAAVELVINEGRR